MSTPRTQSLSIKSPVEDASAGTPRILVADDDAVIVHTISKALKKAGYAVTGVSDGLKAWESLTTQRFDLVLTDEEMPGLTGHELILKARQHKLTFPIIVVSGRLDFFLTPDNEALPVAQFLQKPFSLRQLTEAVARVLQLTSTIATQPKSGRAPAAKCSPS